MDAFRDEQKFLTEFDLIVSGDSIYEKIKSAEKYGTEKEGLEKRFDSIELFYQQKILRMGKMNEGLNIAKILDKIAQSREYLNKNVNPRLIWENILLTKGIDD